MSLENCSGNSLNHLEDGSFYTPNSSQPGSAALPAQRNRRCPGVQEQVMCGQQSHGGGTGKAISHALGLLHNSNSNYKGAA